ncbi:MAG: glycoside hydrolase family 15 protein [Terriglobales bacterium]
MSTATSAAAVPGAAAERERRGGEAFGSPGIPPRWTRGGKDAVGTAYASSSRVWFTLAQGTLTEMYFPTIDQPQVRDLQFMFTDGKTFFHGERRDCDSHVEVLEDEALGYRIVTQDRQGRYQCQKEVIADPHLSCILMHAKVETSPALGRGLRQFVLCAPHMGGIGWHNNAEVGEVASRSLLLAHRGPAWLAIGATIPLLRCSAGFVGASDAWTDLAAHLRPTYAFHTATDGNVALSAEMDLSAGREFTLGIAFGDTRQAAINTLLQSLDQPFAAARDRFCEQWRRTKEHRLGLDHYAQDGGTLYQRSVSVLLAHEDKTYPGAMIASLSIPWGETKGDEDLGGYHLVWTRDLVQSATGLLASGDGVTARRALVYLAASQHPDGGFAQNFWVNGTPYWQGVQLDEVAFPILLAWRLRREGALHDIDPYPMVARAVGYLLRHGPATPEERWEEAGGYSPSSLAVHIAGLVCAADLARAHGDAALAQLALDYADFVESHLEAWTVTTQGGLVPGITRHYIRINPAPRIGVGSDEDPNSAVLHINNIEPGMPSEFPARDIMDAGFLELVRYGVRAGGDALIEDSLRVVDALLKVTTPFGDCWRRYNHDGYGQHPDGSAYMGWGRGGAWPLLTGERAHYELAAGRDVTAYVRAMERLANHMALLPEQIWDLPDLPGKFLHFGRPSGSAMPLLWAHSEYVRLLRSVRDGAVFDNISSVSERYGKGRRARPAREVWKFHRQVARMAAGATLRVQVEAPFFLHGSLDGWNTVFDTRSTPTGCGFEYVDVATTAAQRAPVLFTMRYASDGHWQGQDYSVAIH